jgi:hypothetical protein
VLGGGQRQPPLTIQYEFALLEPLWNRPRPLIASLTAVRADAHDALPLRMTTRTVTSAPLPAPP